MIHYVSDGEGYYGIARFYNVDVSLLRHANADRPLWPGQPILVPLPQLVEPESEPEPPVVEPEPEPPVVEPEPEPEPPVVEPPVGMPTMQSIIGNAGLSDPDILTPSSTVRVTVPDAVVENLDVAGNIIVEADNVTIRNCRVTGSSSTAVIKPARDVQGTTVEHCEVVVGKANGAIGFLGYGTTVRNCRISGFADGLKFETGGWYEGNHIQMTEPPGQAKHLDSGQGSADRNYTVKHNVLDAWTDPAHNASLMIQAWNGAINVPIYGIRIIENYVGGGNFSVQLMGGKDNQPLPPGYADADELIYDTHFIGNVFRTDLGALTNTPRYGNIRVANCAGLTIYGNVDHLGNVVNPCD